MQAYGKTAGLICLAAALLLPVGAAAQQSGSNASNYGSGAQLSVNPRTGALTLSAALFKIPGIVSGMDATLALTFRSDDAQTDVENRTSYFGLPYGWSLGLSFLYNDGEQIELNLDGQQSYVLDDEWTSSFTPVGASEALAAKTGLKQYNLMDANLRLADGTQTINGATVGYVFATLDGQAQYFSENGLLLRRADRFGNQLDYTYSDMSGDATGVTLTGITDSWGNDITIAPCSGDQCHTTEYTEIVVSLPDGRAVSWISEDEYTVSYLIDAQGKVTHIGWIDSPAAHGEKLISSMTTPSGGMTSVVWDRLAVCTEPASTNSCVDDGNTTTWPVVTTLYECPNNASGKPCPEGSTDDFQTTSYAYTTANGEYNYTGYPLYSPYAPKDPSADALMSSNNTAYVYTTVTGTQTYGGTLINQVESDYNFVHVLQERRIFVRAEQPNGDQGMSLSKVTSYCYSLPSAGNSASACAMDAADYQLLPANYQSPTRIGSCQFNVGRDADPSQGRRSLLTTAYDGFGHAINKQKYHGTTSDGISSCSDRSTRLSASGLQLVTDAYMAFDTPGKLDSDKYLSLGPGSGDFGLPTAQQSFIYLDTDEHGAEVHGALGATTGPVMVKLRCNDLTTDSTNIHVSTDGLMATTVAKPATAGLVPACGESKPWTATIAPPKTSTLSYDSQGRATSHASAWTSGYTAPDGVAATGRTTSYTLTEVKTGEEACGSATAKTILEVTATALADPTAPATTSGNVAQTHRTCTLNGFHLSSTQPYDPTAASNVPTTYYTHFVDGLTKSTLHPNGTGVTVDYYYDCAMAQDGQTSTCPSFSTAKSDCPYTAAAGRNCVVQTLHAGQGNTSYVDGVASVIVKDGLGRAVAHLDNTGGAAAGQGFTEQQTRRTATFDSVGLTAARTSEVGVASPLVYTTTVEQYGPKLRPSLVCGPRGTAHQFVHDDVQQQTKTIINGADKETYTLNDSRKMTRLVSCELTENTTSSGSSACPTVAASTASTTCSGDGYYSYTLYDGGGLPHSVQASAGDQSDALASIQSVTGQTTTMDGDTAVSAFSADLLQYGYTFTSTANANGGAVTATTSFQRNLIGRKRQQQLTVTANAATTDVVSDLFAYNALADQQSETNRMSTNEVTLDKLFTYTPPGKLETFTSYAGVTFHNYYDDMQQLVRHCYPGDESGSQGENFTVDAITGEALKIARFTNPDPCSADTSKDTEGIWQTYAYTRFGSLKSITYSDGTKLEWAFDAYQRPSCFADAIATKAGSSCPASPTAADFSPSASSMLTAHQYYPDSDTYRRGKLQQSCRGVPDGNGGHVMKCLEFDYYSPTTAGGMCKDGDIATDGSCPKGEASVTGAFAGALLSEAYYTGGPSDNGGTLVYQTTHSYEAHRRPAAIVTKDAASKIVLASTYAYDQYDNVTMETSRSDLDTAATSNYQVIYGYDGLLRLISAEREGLDGKAIRSTTYEYDASSNLTKKVEVTPDEDG